MEGQLYLFLEHVLYDFGITIFWWNFCPRPILTLLTKSTLMLRQFNRSLKFRWEELVEACMSVPTTDNSYTAT
jgi:hypothetical protein